MAIWLVFLTALYWSSQNGVEMVSIPKEHLKEAILCLRECIGEDLVPRQDLSYGEYLGDLCKSADINDIQEKIKIYAPFGGLKVLKCLEKKGLADVYTKFRDFGSERLKEILVEKLTKIKEQLLGSDEPLQSSLELNNVKLTQFSPWNSIGSTSPSPKPPGKDSEFTDFGKYVIGLCMKDDSINYQELRNDQDKEDAFNCLKDCELRFMMRIEEILKLASGISINTLGEVIDILNKYLKEPLDEAESELRVGYEEFMMYFREMTNIKKPADSLFKRVIYTSKIRKISDDKPSSSNTISGINKITYAGEFLMNRYSQVYTFIDTYRNEISKPPKGGIQQELLRKLEAIFVDTEDEESLDSDLWLFFVYYQFCAKVQCYMKAPESVPLYSLIHKKASNSCPMRKFYVALIGRLDGNNGIDGDSSDKKGKAIIPS